MQGGTRGERGREGRMEVASAIGGRQGGAQTKRTSLISPRRASESMGFSRNW